MERSAVVKNDPKPARGKIYPYYLALLMVRFSLTEDWERYINPKYEQVLDTRKLDNNVFYSVTKRDNGALPDATLDIWKTGVELFDLKWSSTLSFKGRYFYSF
ncbi:hypothetical protein J2W91_005624 [Paenibacillus amylolyticus]|uniref:Uncharacterized protein n=1 Tax=Paenibacillus amylolyticus TaxID=1451 RepID=A0AAP5LU01_PAEAM|nr:hypothetical protein [Paenibacillus amylolyticus]